MSRFTVRLRFKPFRVKVGKETKPTAAVGMGLPREGVILQKHLCLENIFMWAIGGCPHSSKEPADRVCKQTVWGNVDERHLKIRKRRWKGACFMHINE